MFEHATSQRAYDMRVTILDAANDLLRAYSYAQLTVNNICRVAEISKPTFYRYFSDKYEIAEWALADFARAPLLEVIHTTRLEDSFCITAGQLRRYKDFFRKAFAGSGAETLLELTGRTIRQGFEDVLYRRHGISRSERIEFQVEYTSQMEPDMTAKWLAKNLMVPDEQFAHMLALAVPTQLRELYDSLVSK